MTTEAHFYQAHVFVCQNERPATHERGCCNSKGATKLRNYMKVRAKELGLPMTRINTAGCLDRCELGPVMVIYPEGTWYRYETIEDIDTILNDHLVGGKVVERLRLSPASSLGQSLQTAPTGAVLCFPATRTVTSWCRFQRSVNQTGNRFPRGSCGGQKADDMPLSAILCSLKALFVIAAIC